MQTSTAISQQSRLLLLPRELRDIIIDFNLAASLHITAASFDKSAFISSTARPDPTPRPLGLLGTCAQLRAETLDRIAWLHLPPTLLIRNDPKTDDLRTGDYQRLRLVSPNSMANDAATTTLKVHLWYESSYTLAYNPIAQVD
jgi:hypothetical protein